VFENRAQPHPADPLTPVRLAASVSDEVITSDEPTPQMQRDEEENVEVLQKDLSRTKEEPINFQVNNGKDDPFNKCVLAQTALPRIRRAQEK
jgi:hypothetical protein